MFGVSWHPHPDVWALILSLILFFEIPGKGLKDLNLKRKYWYSGVLLLWVWTDWPLHDIGEQYLFSVHSVEHLVLALVAPPLLLMGLHKEQKKIILTEKTVPVISTLSKPLVALSMFNLIIVGMHWSTIINLMITSSLVHFALHSLMLLVSLNMWIPVIGLDSRINQLSFPARIGYLFGQSLLPTIPASFLVFSNVPIYKAYENIDQIYNISALDDQSLAGLILKLGGGIFLWITNLTIWMHWYKTEKKASDYEKHIKRESMKS